MFAGPKPNKAGMADGDGAIGALKVREFYQRDFGIIGAFGRGVGGCDVHRIP